MKKKKKRRRDRGWKLGASIAENSKYKSDLPGHCGNHAHQCRMINHTLLNSFSLTFTWSDL